MSVVAGTPINSGSGWNTFGLTDYGWFAYYDGLGTEWGLWQGQSSQFAGFRFSDGADWHYGWVRLSVEPLTPYGSSTYRLTIHDWAYNDVANNSILAGDTASAVPEPSTIFLLGVGGAVAWRWRKRNRK